MFAWRGNDPDFAQKKIRQILEDKFFQQFQKTPKKVEGGLSGS